MKLIETVFLGFQFESGFYSKSTLENLLIDAVTEASKEIKKIGLDYVDLKPQLIDLKPSEGVTDGIIKFIEKSIFCLFEISDNNPNVMFELGNAYAKNKGLIFLKHIESTSTKQVPSDIIGKFILYYGGGDYPDLEKMRPKIVESIRDYVIDVYNKKSETWMRRIWDIKGDNLVVVSGNLFSKYIVEPRDADAMFASTLKLVNLYPGLKVKRFYSKDFPEKSFQGNDLLVVGGPDSNKITKKILEGLDPTFPFSYEETDEPYDFVLKDRSSLREFKKRFDGKDLKSDYGFFLKVPNPYASERNILLITGIGGEGTFACSQALPFGDDEFLFDYYYNNFSKLSEKRYFCFVTEALVKTTTVEGRVVEGTTYCMDQSNNAWKKL